MQRQFSPTSPDFVTLQLFNLFLFIATTNNYYSKHPLTLNWIYQSFFQLTRMCPSCNGDAPPSVNGQVNGANGYGEHTPHNPRRQPFASVGDYLSNVSNFRIIESTLREGEQVTKDPRV